MKYESPNYWVVSTHKLLPLPWMQIELETIAKDLKFPMDELAVNIKNSERWWAGRYFGHGIPDVSPFYPLRDSLHFIILRVGNPIYPAKLRRDIIVTNLWENFIMLAAHELRHHYQHCIRYHKEHPHYIGQCELLKREKDANDYTASYLARWKESTHKGSLPLM